MSILLLGKSVVQVGAFQSKAMKDASNCKPSSILEMDYANLGCQVQDELQSWWADFRKTTQQQQLGVNNQDVTGRKNTSLAAEIRRYSLLFLARVRSVCRIICFHFPLRIIGARSQKHCSSFVVMQISTLHSRLEIVQGHDITSPR